MKVEIKENGVSKFEELENRIAELEGLIEAIKAGEVDAFAITKNNKSEIFTLRSADYTYRVLVENFGEGALSLSEDGLIIYTNTYFCKLLDLNYEKVAGHSVFPFIHPDSRDDFISLFRKGLAGQGRGEINLWVNKKIIPVYVSLTSLYPTLPNVGMLVTDLTEKKKHEHLLEKYQKDLEIKNHELAQSNAELASFSYIASHDLQEPLRKIQTFSDRILDKASDTLTHETRDYFQRILSATGLMQNLIIALLDYSRINSSEIVFETADLDSIVEKVKNELAEIIEETDTVIENAPLTVLQVIPLQFEQLLTNIILNAIKYKKPGIPPVIKISGGIVAASKLRGLSAKPQGGYYKISIADNGIGFEQVHAEKIFELFQRLHGRSEYEGTGIGLAICKKIVQNHKGFIRAESAPGAGSTFTVFLPLKH
jgi:PAS domain S-box-containing protein